MTSEQLKSARESLDLTQEELAEKLGKARNTITRWEIGSLDIPEWVELALKGLGATIRQKPKR